MFKCEMQKCGVVTQPRQPANRIIVQTRKTRYENMIHRGPHKGEMLVTEGTEIVKEIKVCPTCYEIFTGNKPAIPLPSNRTTIDPNVTKRHRKYSERDNRPRQNPRQNQQRKPVVEVVNPLTSLPIIRD